MALRSDLRQLGCASQHHHELSGSRLATAPVARQCRVVPVPAHRWQSTTVPQSCAVPSCSPRCSRSRLSIVCMAHPRRVAKVTSQVQKEISNMFIYDPVVVKAITPERAGGANELSALVSATHVYVSNDLQIVKIYVSIYSDERGKQKAMNNLKRLEGYVRREMGQRVPLRLTPEYRFEYDDSIEEQDLVERVIGTEDVARFKQELGQTETDYQLQGGVWAGPSGGPAGDGDAQGDGFFDADDMEDEEEEGRYVEYSSADVFKRPGPFDDLFGGAVLPREGEGRGRGGRGGRGGGRGRGGAQQQRDGERGRQAPVAGR